MFKENLIINLPDISEFAFSGEWLYFLGLCILLVTTLVFAITGYKHFISSVALIVICLLGYVGFELGKMYTDVGIFLMVFVISFAFLGCTIIYLLGSLFFTIAKGAKVKDVLINNMYIISSLLGALAFSFLIYLFVLNNPVVCIGVFTVLFLIGFMHQKKSRKEQIKFHTYDDIFYKEETNKEV